MSDTERAPRKHNEKHEGYPPPVIFVWRAVSGNDEIGTELARAAVEGPGHETSFTPKDALVIEGCEEELEIISMLSRLAAFDLTSTGESYPFALTIKDGKLIAMLALGLCNVGVTHPDGTKGLAIVISGHESKTEAEYLRARGMFLEGLNKNLGKIGRANVPTPPFR